MRKKRINPNISSLPRSMVKDNVHLPATGMSAKLLIDPTIPNPGPTFPIVAAEPENALRASTPRAVKIRADIKTIHT